jgi:hypothetical protein
MGEAELVSAIPAQIWLARHIGHYPLPDMLPAIVVITSKQNP